MSDLINDPEPAGIGGWLLLMAWVQILGPLKFFVSLARYYASIDAALVEKIPLTFTGEVLLNALVGALWVYTAVLFFRRSRRFPEFFVYEIVAAALLLPIATAWVSFGIRAEMGHTLGPSMWSLVELREVMLTVAGVIVGGIWIVYLKKSRRAANTFVH